MKVRLNKKQKIKIHTSADIYKIMRQVLLRQNKLRRNREYFWTIGLSEKSDIEYLELIAIGKLNIVHIDPVEILTFAVQKRCKRIILIHNHPDGNITPSDADDDTTFYIHYAAAVLKIELIDCLIISEEKYYSFADEKKTPFDKRRKKPLVKPSKK